MRKLIIVFLITLITKHVSSQGDHFIYIQADNQKPFYVRSGAKVFRSSGEGYLVIPGLTASNYEMIIGFSGAGSTAEWRFECTIGEKDLGFTLKNNGPAPPQLIHLRQKSGITGTKVQAKEDKKAAPQNVIPTGVISDDPFSKMLAAVVNDPTIRQQPVIIEKKTAPAFAASGVDSTSLATANTGNKDVASQQAGVPATSNRTLPAASNNNEPFVVKETPLKPDSSQAKTSAAAKRDSLDGAKTVAAKQQDNQPFVVKEIKKESKKDISRVDSSTAQATRKQQEPFVVKETVTTKPAGIKDSSSRAVATRANAPKPDVQNNQPKNEPFVVKEQPDTEATAAVSNGAGGKKTLPFTVEPKQENPAPKEVAKADNKTSKATDSGSKTTSTAAAAQPKEAPFVVKELAKADSKTTSSPTDNASDKKTLPFTVQPGEEPAVTREVPKSNTKTQQNTTANTANSSNVTTVPKEEKPFVLKETVAGKKDQPVKTVATPAPAVSGVRSSVAIKKTLQRKSIDGIELIYVDEGLNGAKDTIRILIPAEK